MNYTINGITHHIILSNDAEWEAFIDNMTTLAEQGNEVKFLNKNRSSQTSATKDVQTFTTTDKDEANAWAKKMADKGYAVEIAYKNGEYTCIAILE